MRSRVYVTVGRPSFHPSVCLQPLYATATGLLLWARWPGDIDRLLHGKRSAAACGSQMKAVPRFQLTQEAEHGLVNDASYSFIIST